MRLGQLASQADTLRVEPSIEQMILSVELFIPAASNMEHIKVMRQLEDESEIFEHPVPYII